MKKYRFYSILGLASTGIILINYIIYFTLLEYDHLTNGALLLITLFSMFSGIYVFLALRFIIVTKAKQDGFRIVIPMIIISQILASGLTLLIKYQAFPLMYVVIPFLIIGTVLAGSYVWFFIILSKTDRREVYGLPFLEYFGITLFVLFIIKAIFSIMPNKGFKTFDSVIQLLEAFPYVFIFIFFIRHIKQSKNE